MSMLKLPVNRPVTTIMLFFGISLLGVISWFRLPQELFPSLEYPQISIVTKYEGAGPEESEKLISKIIEEAVGTVKNVSKVKSVSKEGSSIVTCEFKWGTDMNMAAMDVREKIDLVKQSLPRDAQEPIVLKYNPFQMEAMILSVSYTDSATTTDPWRMAQLRQVCKKQVKDDLERLDGVAKVEIRGGEQEEVLVEIDKGRLLANQVSIMEVINSIRDANITYPAGVIKEDMYEYLVKTVGEFQTTKDIEDLSFGKEDMSVPRMRSTYRRIRGENSYDRRKIVFVRDIAEVKRSLKDRTGYSRYNRTDNISLGVYPQSGSNLIRISEAVRRRMKEIRTRLPADVDVKIIYDQSEFIKTSLNNIYMSALQGGLLSFVILYIFLHSVAASLIISTAIPVSILVTLSLMYFGDISINTMSLGGFAIGVGMVVDNSNIVLENIFAYQHKHPGLSRKELIYRATSEVVAPIISGTLTTIAIFLPFIFVAGMIGQLFKELALTITFSMIASIFVALFLVPRLALYLNLDKNTGGGGRRIIDFFTPLLRRVVRWPVRKMFLCVAAYLAVGALIYAFLPKEFMPRMDERRFVLNVSMHPETPLEVTNETTRRIENAIMAFPEIKDIATTVGSTEDTGGAGAISALGSYQARIVARLRSGGRSTNEIAEQVGQEIKGWNIKGLETEFVTQQGLFGSDVGASSGITIEVRGKDLDKLSDRAKLIKSRMAGIPEIYGIKTEPADLVPELKLVIDRERASLFGLSTQDISAMSLAAIKGYVATKLKQKDDEFDIRVRLRPEDRDNLDKVMEMTAYSQWGMTIQLKQISQFNFVRSLPEIKRIEGERTYFIKAGIKGKFSEAVGKLNEMLAYLPANEDVTEIITGELLAMKESVQSSLFALLLGVIIIYMILASQFESMNQPFIVMTTVPLGLVGAFYTLFLTGQSINSISMLGLIMLTGNAVNAAIILVDRYNSVSSETDEEMEEGVVTATSDHLRPILMTTLTTIIGLIPLALGIGEGAGATSPMAITIVGGLTFCLVLTVFFVPYFYLKTRQIRIRMRLPDVRRVRSFRLSSIPGLLREGAYWVVDTVRGLMQRLGI